MSSYECIDQMWLDILYELLGNGDQIDSRNGPTREILSYRGVLESPESSVLCNSVRNFSLRYGLAEFIWYMSGSNDGNVIAHYAPSYRQFLTPEGIAEGAYGARMSAQLDRVLYELRLNPMSRRAVIALYDAEDCGKESLDIPCTLSLQFLLRDERLHCICTMRSNDVWLGMPNDIFCFTLIQKTLANSLGVSLGSYVHQVGSMHLYAQNAEKAKLACFDYPDEITKLAMDDTLSDVLCDWVQVESEARQGLPCSVSRLEGLYDVLVGGK